MIYLDNAATSWPKPDEVINSIEDCLINYCANPGRSGHDMALKTEKEIFKCRSYICDMFGLDEPSNVIFTFNATHGLNIVIKGLLNSDKHVIVTSMEHNSVLRPVVSSGADYDLLMADEFGYVDYNLVESLIKDNTALIICTLSSNVCGSVQPFCQIAEIAHRHNIPFLLDASQGAGNIALNMKKMNIDFLVAPGHKGLLGPTGTGILCINYDTVPESLIEGGTGSDSKLLCQPGYLPDKFESGTLNVAGIIGLKSGIEFINRIGQEEISAKEEMLAKKFAENLFDIKGVSLKGFDPLRQRYPVISFVLDGYDCLMLAARLNYEYAIAVRAGYHCAYTAHASIGTEKTGTVRVSVGYFNTFDDIDSLSVALKEIALQS